MKNSQLMILLSIVIFFFVVLPVVVLSPAAGGILWVGDIFLLLVGYSRRKEEVKAEKIRQRAQLEEEGRQRARQDFSPSQQIVKETIITKEVLIQCRSCGARYPQGTPKCLTCGANL